MRSLVRNVGRRHHDSCPTDKLMQGRVTWSKSRRCLHVCLSVWSLNPQFISGCALLGYCWARGVPVIVRWCRREHCFSSLSATSRDW